MNLRFVFSLIVSLLSLLPAAAQDLTRNWIRERIFLDAEGKECVTSVQYFDGIGRETLLLTDGLSPGGDVAGALTGESFAGRTSAKWLPATGLTGFDFLTPERVKSLAVSSHEGDSVPFSLTRRDALGRVSSVRNAGGDLAGKAKYRYFVRDRLGSVRSVADEDGNVLQQNLYYAWGGAWGDVCTAPGFQSYKYCGKYLDRKHGLDLYDYGARLYDPAAAFWTSPDPLCEKYYNISPYAFCNNNPVTFIDPDGRDGVLLVDNQSNTITVRANYYMETKERISKEGNKIVQYSENQIASMNKNVNEYLNALGLKVSEGEYTGYSIVFALKFINGGSQTETTRLAGNDYFNYPGYQEVRIGNKIYRMDNTHERIIQKVYADGTTETVGGLAERNEIMMNVEYDTFNNRIHEIFHTFGFEDIKKWKIGHGIMNIPPKTPNQQDADLLINNGFLPKIILR